MKTIAIIVFRNQNEVSPSEASKIRRTIKKHFPESRLRMYINDKAVKAFNEGVNEDYQIVLRTSDVNYECGASVDYSYTTIGLPFVGIAL